MPTRPIATVLETMRSFTDPAPDESALVAVWRKEMDLSTRSVILAVAVHDIGAAAGLACEAVARGRTPSVVADALEEADRLYGEVRDGCLCCTRGGKHARCVGCCKGCPDFTDSGCAGCPVCKPSALRDLPNVYTLEAFIEMLMPKETPDAG